MARMNSLGYLVCNGVPLTAASLACNKIAIQAMPTTAVFTGAPTNAAGEVIFIGKQGMNKATGAGVYAFVLPGGGLVVGDEYNDDVFDANRDFYVDSQTGAGVIAGFAYQR